MRLNEVVDDVVGKGLHLGVSPAVGLHQLLKAEAEFVVIQNWRALNQGLRLDLVQEASLLHGKIKGVRLDTLIFIHSHVMSRDGVGRDLKVLLLRLVCLSCHTSTLQIGNKMSH